MSAAETPNEQLSAQEVGQTWTPPSCRTEFLSLGGHGSGTPAHATVTSFGPVGLPLLDLKDQRAVVQLLACDERDVRSP